MSQAQTVALKPVRPPLLWLWHWSDVTVGILWTKRRLFSAAVLRKPGNLSIGYMPIYTKLYIYEG